LNLDDDKKERIRQTLLDKSSIRTPKIKRTVAVGQERISSVVTVSLVPKRIQQQDGRVNGQPSILIIS
jgi:hypothetical protein